MRKAVKNINAYIKAAPKEVQPLLKKIKQIVEKESRGAEGKISYGMPAFKYQGKIIMYFAAFKNHIGLFPPVPKILTKEASRYMGPKGNLRFPFHELIPYELIQKIIRIRVKELDKK